MNMFFLFRCMNGQFLLLVDYSVPFALRKLIQVQNIKMTLAEPRDVFERELNLR